MRTHWLHLTLDVAKSLTASLVIESILDGPEPAESDESPEPLSRAGGGEGDKEGVTFVYANDPETKGFAITPFKNIEKLQKKIQEEEKKEERRQEQEWS